MDLALINPALPQSDLHVEQLVEREIRSILPPDDAAGAAVAVHVNGRTRLFSYGWADRATNRRVDSDSVFNLASVSKVFDTTLLALAATQGELRLDDAAAQHVPELRGGGDIRRVTLGHLATYTSGFTLPQDHPPWPERNYTWPDFVQVVNEWKADKDSEPGQQVIYSHGGFMLLHVALERRFATPYSDLLERRVLAPLGLTSTTLPKPGAMFRGELAPALQARAVQGHSFEGKPAGAPGEQQGFYHWPGTGQMYGSLRDLSAFLRANLGEGPDPQLGHAMTLAQQPVFTMSHDIRMGLAWELFDLSGVTIVEKYGGLYNASAYIGMIPPKKIGVVVLANRGGQDVAALGRRLMLEWVGQAEPASGQR